MTKDKVILHNFILTDPYYKSKTADSYFAVSRFAFSVNRQLVPASQNADIDSTI